MSDKFTKICNYAKVIAKKPNTRSDYFYLDEYGQMMMLSANKLAELPRELEEMKKRQYWILFIDLENTKTLRWFGYDIGDPLRETFKNELEGVIPWSLMEDLVLAFFEKNIGDLCQFTNPNEELERILNKHSATTHSQTSFYETRHPTYHQRNTYDHRAYQNNYDSVWGQAYKDREAFLSQLYKLINEGKTGKAIDFISEKMTALAAENKLEAINGILQTVDPNKLDLLTKIQLLKTTKNCDTTKLFDRKLYFNKIKPHFENLQSVLGKKLFQELEEIMQVPARVSLPTEIVNSPPSPDLSTSVKDFSIN